MHTYCSEILEFNVFKKYLKKDKFLRMKTGIVRAITETISMLMLFNYWTFCFYAAAFLRTRQLVNKSVLNFAEDEQKVYTGEILSAIGLAIW